MATFTVTEQAATGAGSLAAAIALAEASAGPDTIVFAASVSRIVTSATLTINSNITIDGDRNNDGVADVTISSDIDTDGVGNHMLFMLGTGANVTFDGLVFTKGRSVGATTDGVAGAILNNGIATIRNSQFADNQAIGLAGQQGTIGHSGNISGGDGSTGGSAAGAILNRGIMSIQNTVFSDNSGLGGNGGAGGNGITEYAMINGVLFPIAGGSGGDGGNGGYGVGAIVNFTGGSLTLSSGVVMENNTGAAGNGGNGGDAAPYGGFVSGGVGGVASHGSASILDFGTMSGTANFNAGAFSGAIGGEVGDPAPDSDYPYVRPDGVGAVQPVRIGTAGNDSSAGLAFSEVFGGLGGDDTFVISAGNDVFNGGAGSDTANFGLLTAGITFNLSLTTAQSIGIGTLSAVDVENVTGGAGDDTIIGNGSANRLEGRNGNDTLDGGTGVDTMVGGLGNDTCYVDNAGDQFIETAGGGSDRVLTSISYSLAAGTEIEMLSAAAAADTVALNLTGNEFAQTLRGNAGNNFLNGAAGADLMYGLAGNDTYVIDNVGDRVAEAVGNGFDGVQAAITYALQAGSEIEVLATTDNNGTVAVDLTGNEFAQAVYGNQGTNLLNGGGGADTLIGWSGDDIYRVDNADDTVIEDAGRGNDRVISSVDYVLDTGQEVELLTTHGSTGTAPLALTGNNLTQRIVGNAGNNVLNSAGGGDTLEGRTGNDTYHANSDDAIIETSTGGDDRVIYYNGGQFTLAAGVAIETAELWGGAGNASLTGNEFAQLVAGNDGNNILSGLGSADTLRGLVGIDNLYGGEGNDTLDGGLGADYLSGGTGSDRASYTNASTAVKVSLASSAVNTGEATGDTYNSIENLTGSNYGDSLTGSDGANRISGANGNDTINGLKGNDVIFGGSGNDRIYGHLGSDTLEGNAGSDTFIFHTALGATNIDTIADFNRAADTIELWNDVFTALGTGALAASAFKDMAVSAKDASDRIIYNSDTGILYYDADGSGTAYGNVKFAVLTGKPDITASDFVVV